MTAGSSDLGTRASGLGGQAPWRITATGHHSSRRAPHSPPVVCEPEIFRRTQRAGHQFLPGCCAPGTDSPVPWPASIRAGRALRKARPRRGGLHLPRGAGCGARETGARAGGQVSPSGVAGQPCPRTRMRASRGESRPMQISAHIADGVPGAGTGVPRPQALGGDQTLPPPACPRPVLNSITPRRPLALPGPISETLVTVAATLAGSVHNWPAWWQPGAAPGLQGRAPMRGRHAGPANNASP